LIPGIDPAIKFVTPVAEGLFVGNDRLRIVIGTTPTVVVALPIGSATHHFRSNSGSRSVALFSGILDVRRKGKIKRRVAPVSGRVPCVVSAATRVESRSKQESYGHGKDE